MTSNIPKLMRAVVCPSVPVPPSGLVYTTSHPAPSPKVGHVLIRVKAFGLNRSELFTRQGLSPGLKFPRVLGIECVGEVKDTGGNQTLWKVGDAVAAIMGGMGRAFDGGYAEYTLVPHSSVSPPIKLPENVGWAEFAAMPETFMTAYGALNDSLKFEHRDTLFIRGGSTSVGLAAASLAKALFACGRVIATTRSSKKVAALKSAGVDDVVLDTGKVSEEVMKLTDGKGADKCIELVGATTLADSCASISSEGVICSVGCVSGEWVIKDFDPMASLRPRKRLTMYGSDTADLHNAPVQKIVDLISTGDLKVSLDKTFKLEEAGEAHAYMEANSAAGKVVCVVD